MLPDYSFQTLHEHMYRSPNHGTVSSGAHQPLGSPKLKYSVFEQCKRQIMAYQLSREFFKTRQCSLVASWLCDLSLFHLQVLSERLVKDVLYLFAHPVPYVRLLHMLEDYLGDLTISLVVDIRCCLQAGEGEGLAVFRWWSSNVDGCLGVCG